MQSERNEENPFDCAKSVPNFLLGMVEITTAMEGRVAD
jgi:hypothetical protein